MVVLGLIFGIFYGAGSVITSMIQGIAGNNDNGSNKTTQMKRQDGERTNILLLGVDARPGEKESRSDTMLLVSIDPELNRAAVTQGYQSAGKRRRRQNMSCQYNRRTAVCGYGRGRPFEYRNRLLCQD